MHGGRRQGACGRDVHRRPPDGRMATAGRQPRRGSYTISLRQAPAALLARGTWKIPDHHRRVRRLLLYRWLFRVRGEGAELVGDRRQFFYTMVQGVHLENGNGEPKPWHQTELVDAAGRDVKVCSWLKQTTCVKVGCESKNDWASPTELISV